MAARRALIYIVIGSLVLAASAVAGLIIAKRMRTGKWERPTGDDLVWVKDRVQDKLGTRNPPGIIYLHRGKIALRGGRTDSHQDRSLIVGDSESDVANMPGFTSSNKRWKAIAACVEKLFAPFDVEVTQQRPKQRGYVMVVVGGRPQDLGGERKHHAHARVGGLAPFSGSVVHDPVVFAFSRTLRNRTRAVCETIGMEVAHAYGLDHSYECKDVMTYKNGCKKRFLDKDVRCGESKPRDCHGGGKTQNSYRHLLNVLGPRK